jgi:hypothetical protein
VLAGVVLTVARCGGSETGMLHADVTVLAFGEVVKGEQPVRELRVTNGTDHGVVLTAAAPSCACLVPDPTFQRSLQPGESTVIRVRLASDTVNPQNLGGKTFRVSADDPQTPVLMLPVTGRILAWLDVKPTAVRVSADDAAGRGEPRRIAVRVPSGMTANVKHTITHPEWFKVTPTQGPEGADLLLEVIPDPKRRGAVDEVLRLEVHVSGRGLAPQTLPAEVRIQGTW